MVVRCPPEGVGKRRPRLIDELFSENSESSSTSDATSARWYEAFETRPAASESTRRSEWSSPSETKPRPRGSGRSGVNPTHRKVCRKPLERISKSMQQSARKAPGELQGMRVAEGTPWKRQCDVGSCEKFVHVREDGKGGRRSGSGFTTS